MMGLSVPGKPDTRGHSTAYQTEHSIDWKANIGSEWLWLRDSLSSSQLYDSGLRYSSKKKKKVREIGKLSKLKLP